MIEFISAGKLCEWEAEIGLSDRARLGEMAYDLIQECHRLRHLIEEMAQFRSSVEHDRTMDRLEAIDRKATIRPAPVDTDCQDDPNDDPIVKHFGLESYRQQCMESAGEPVHEPNPPPIF